jgi:hypothetical protein
LISLRLRGRELIHDACRQLRHEIAITVG